jgi:hypothetical protein
LTAGIEITKIKGDAATAPSEKGSSAMSIGGGIALFVIGAILAFAVNVQIEWVNLDLIGYILMGAGVVVFLIGIIMLVRRRSSVSTTRSAVDPASGERITRQSTSTSDDGL